MKSYTVFSFFASLLHVSAGCVFLKLLISIPLYYHNFIYLIIDGHSIFICNSPKLEITQSVKNAVNICD